mgnify:CR=1 FL=1
MKFNKLTNCYMIAEIGVNHGGSVELAIKMVDAAKDAGADAVKFQTFKASTLVSQGTPKVNYQISTTDKDESHYQMIKSLEFKYEDHKPVFNYCKSKDIDFISTPYDLESAIFLDNLGVDIFKTASADIVDIPLHKFLASLNKKVIVSTGMATLGEIENVVSIYREFNITNLAILHCVANYPCAYESLNLNVIKTLRESFKIPVGYSDHAVGCYPAIASIALGAKIIEKHFTLDKKMNGPDHKASNNPKEFAALVEAVRIAEKSMGGSIKQVQNEELQMRNVARKSLFFANNINKGDIISQQDIILKRPGSGIYSTMMDSIIGKKATKNLFIDDIIKYGDFE